MKYIGALIFALCLSAFGFSKAKFLFEGVASCEKINSFLAFLQERISKRRQPVLEIFKDFSSESEFANALALGKTFEDAINISKLSLDDESIKKLITFGNKLGEGTLEQELASCRDISDFFEKKQKDLFENYQKKAPLYRCLGLISGLGILIIIA